MFACPKCAKQYPDDMRICRQCGAILEEVGSQDADDDAAEQSANEHDARSVTGMHIDSPKPSIIAESRSIREERMAEEPRETTVRSAGQCPECGEVIEANFDVCWNCGISFDGQRDPDFLRAPRDAAITVTEDKKSVPTSRVAFKYFKSTWSSWDYLFQEAADFASHVGPQRVISISHSASGNDGTVTVWYWEET